MRAHKALESDDAKEAQWEAARGAAVGAVKWGAASAVLGGIGYVFSPLYRGLTVQFKVYLQMSGMIVGSMIEADYRMRQYEQRIRMQRRIAQNRAIWVDYEKELMELEDEGASSQQNKK
ncbi:putative imidazoleglycerol-phosphate dehydratase protein [Daldinia childiae]|uniref:putative imidazoleglycerol-phosphate dehydratase protein n=1 Tax=Daldinia childiae TaxID=326645 RepID=UPI0014468541|nr:putative imidazoleglycerol-phosphate dehydratase protein [Daldinia childiae]KAF3064503.1 putative imidazoleglycerol-phosphate dehydratase protein [Daldinia childiae]